MSCGCEINLCIFIGLGFSTGNPKAYLDLNPIPNPIQTKFYYYRHRFNFRVVNVRLKDDFLKNHLFALLLLNRLVNIDDIEKSNEVKDNQDFDNNSETNNNNSNEDEFSNDTEEMDELQSADYNINNSDSDFTTQYQGVDIIVSFEPCNHLKHRDKNPNSFLEEYGEDCEGVYAHAHFFGKIPTFFLNHPVLFGIFCLHKRYFRLTDNF